MTKHTPGPWKVNDWGSTVVTLAEIDGNRIHGYGCGNDFICDLNDGEYHEYWSEEEQAANAALIAAAPDLLAACKAMLERYATGYNEHDAEAEQARAAIRKAEGAT